MNNFIKINRVIATKITKLFTLLLALFASVGTMFAWNYERVQIGDLYYNLDDATQTAEVTYEKMDLLFGAYSTLPRVLIIPSSVTYNDNEYTITTIGSLAFAGCSFDSVSILNTVKTIKAQAFYKCSLINITIPESVESIEAYAFEGGIINVNYSGNATGSPWGAKIVNGYFDGEFVFNDKTQTILYAWKEDLLQKDISIPITVKTIRDRVFQNCLYLESITLPNGVESIGEYAFSGCTSLKSLSVPNSATNIDILAFEDVFNISYTGTASGAPWGAKSMNGYIEFPLLFNNLNKDTLVSCYQYAEGNIAIPNAVSVIDNKAFSSCRYITSVTIPNSVTSIGARTFENCTGLTSVTIPNSVTSIGSGAFQGCSGLITPVYNAHLFVYMPKSYSGAYTIQDGIESIAISAFEDCRSLTAVTIPNNVISIGDYAFRNCTGLTSFDIPNSVTSIGAGTFENCTGLTSVTIPNSVTSIGASTFENCTGLTSVTIPGSVTSIGERAFCGCSSLTSIIIPDGVTEIGYSTFYNCTALLDLHIPNSVISIQYNAFSFVPNVYYSGTATGSPWGAKCVNGYAEGLFVYSNNTKSRLEACSSAITGRVKIPQGVKSIEEAAFYHCSQITSVVISEGVTGIYDDAFRGCSQMTSITIPSTVRWMYRYLFAGCSNLKRVYACPTVPPYHEGESGGFSFPQGVTVYVPVGYADAYQNAQYWKGVNFIEKDALSSNQSVGATSFSLELNHNFWNLDSLFIVSIGIEGGEQQPGNVLEHIGLEPNSEYKDRLVVLTSNTGETETVNVSFTTTALELTTKASKPVSSTTAILLAETNMADAEVNCGFEYKRNDASADMAGTKVYCPVASGQMAGRLKNLKDDVYYKYRAFYESAAGMMYYGDWQYIFTGDESVEFQPIINTYAATAITEHQATLRGYALEGSEDFTEQGFEYWVESRLKTNKMPARNQKSQIGEKKTITASGISMKVTLMELDPGSVYKYRTYAKIGNQTVYGSEMSFTTLGEWVAYTVTFVGKDGKVISTQEVEPGDDAIAPEAPEVDGFRFTGWDIEFTNVQSNLTITAQYSEIVMVTLVVTSSDTSMGIVKGGGEYAEGIKVKITAVPNEGYIFVMWNDGNTDNPRTVTAANKTYTAIFEEQQQSVDQITNNQSQTTNKIIKDNHIYILRDGKIFDLTGKEVR